MEALRLIKTARHALAETRNIPDVLAEARQAALLAEAVGARLVRDEDGELAGLGQQLSEAALHAACCLDHATGDVAGASGGGARPPPPPGGAPPPPRAGGGGGAPRPRPPPPPPPAAPPPAPRAP
ncbi:DUF6099 family protein, partial [Kitasatospora sp. NPDC059463]|uniref:DUF6099 family protein n=1 Tax=Kitasatospora sp. NPDC059463 TaxID=3346842 RepID=UPI003689C11E